MKQETSNKHQESIESRYKNESINPKNAEEFIGMLYLQTCFDNQEDVLKALDFDDHKKGSSDYYKSKRILNEWNESQKLLQKEFSTEELKKIKLDYVGINLEELKIQTRAHKDGILLFSEKYPQTWLEFSEGKIIGRNTAKNKVGGFKEISAAILWWHKQVIEYEKTRDQKLKKLSKKEQIKIHNENTVEIGKMFLLVCLEDLEAEKYINLDDKNPSSPEYQKGLTQLLERQSLRAAIIDQAKSFGYDTKDIFSILKEFSTLRSGEDKLIEQPSLVLHEDGINQYLYSHKFHNPHIAMMNGSVYNRDGRLGFNGENTKAIDRYEAMYIYIRLTVNQMIESDKLKKDE